MNFGGYMHKKLRINNIFLLYTIAFLLLSSVILLVANFKEVSLVYDADALVQHFPAQFFMNDYIYDAIRSFGKNAASFNFNLGLGQDILTTYHYYGLTDPLNLIMVFSKNIEPQILYTIRIFLRIYLSGIAFIIMCMHFKKNKEIIVAGALIYTFSNYTLTPGVMHLYFTNSMIILPILILSIDRLIRKNKPFLFIFTMVIAVFMNIYFAYMLSLTAFVYAIVSILLLSRENGFRKSVKIFVSGISSYLLSILIAGVVFVPVIYSLFINSIRTIGKIEPSYLMSKTEIIDYFYSMFGLPNMTNFALAGISIVTMFSVIDLWINRGNYKLKILMILSILLILSPKIHKVMGAFSYDNFRWYFIIILLLSYIFVDRYDSLKNLEKNKKVLMIIITFILLGGYTLKTYNIISNQIQGGNIYKSYILGISIPIFVGIIYMIILLAGSKKRLIYMLLIASLLMSNFVYIWSGINNGALVDKKELEKMYKIKYENVEKNKNDGFSRFDNQMNGGYNLSDIYNYKSGSVYYSIENKNLSEFNLEYMNSTAAPVTKLHSFDSRARLNSILSTKYYYGDKAPFGYEKKGKIYEDSNYIPFGFTYDKYIEEEYLKYMNPLDKEDILMNACIINSYTPDKIGFLSKNRKEKYDLSNIEKLDNSYFKKNDLKKSDVHFKPGFIKDGNKVDLSDSYINNHQGYNLVLDFNTRFDGELYMRLKSQDTFINNDVIYVDNGKNKSTIKFTKESSNWYSGEKEKLCNLGYIKKGKHTVIINIPQKGSFSINDIKLECIDLDNLENNKEKLSKNHLKEVNIGKDKFNGKIDLDKDKILFISIPYSKGWIAKDNGKETEIIRANTGFMAIKLKAGKHNVDFEYKGPWQNYGNYASIAGIIILLVYFILRKGFERENYGWNKNTSKK